MEVDTNAKKKIVAEMASRIAGGLISGTPTDKLISVGTQDAIVYTSVHLSKRILTVIEEDKELNTSINDNDKE